MKAYCEESFNNNFIRLKDVTLNENSDILKIILIYSLKTIKIYNIFEQTPLPRKIYI